jgi:hypothetical protein
VSFFVFLKYVGNMGEDSRPEGIVPPGRRTPEESSIKKYFLGV